MSEPIVIFAVCVFLIALSAPWFLWRHGSWFDRIWIISMILAMATLGTIIIEAHYGIQKRPHGSTRSVLQRIRADALNFGHPAPQCPVEGHKGPICQMRACAKYDENGKVTGKRCSMFCAKSCCGCGEACTMDEGSSPDEEWFGAMFSLPVGG